jgi:2,3-bisphosphoglycerate-independent phosphoglycerate mutase
MKKIIYIVLDGLGDEPHPDFGNQTPLEQATTPSLDKLAEAGQTGLMYTVEKGVAPESDIAVISILGYETEKVYTGRGPLECFAEGIDVKDGDLAYRVNFATAGDNLTLIDRRVGRDLTTAEATALSREINQKVKLEQASFIFKNTIGHRGVLLIRAQLGRLSAEVTNTDPAYDKKGTFGVARATFEKRVQECRPVSGKESLVEAQTAARITNEFIQKSHTVLNNCAVNKNRIAEGKLAGNVILTRDGGDRLPSFKKIGEKFGLRFGCFVEMPVEKGIALLTGMEVIPLPLPSGDLIRDYGLRAEKTLAVLGDYEGLYIHIKGPDEPAHDGNFLKKKESIELIDKYYLKPLLEKINLQDFIVAVTADHSTSCLLKAHSADPVPVLIAGGGVDADNIKEYTEKTCQGGKLGILMGPELMPLLVNFARG